MGALLTGFLYIIGVFWIIVGALLVFATDLVRKKFIAKFLKIADLKKWVPIPIALGILLLLAASHNRYPLLIILIGLLAIAKGIVVIVAREKVDKILNWWLKAGNNVYKVCGVVMIILGSVVLMGI